MDAIGIGDDGREDMKRDSKLWHELVSFENLYLAYCKARKGKRNSRAATYFEYRLERELSELRLDLITESYRPGNYRTFNMLPPDARTDDITVSSGVPRAVQAVGPASACRSVVSLWQPIDRLEGRTGCVPRRGW